MFAFVGANPVSWDTLYLNVPPDVTHGLPTGWGDWRLCVEALLIESAADMLVGRMQVGTARVAHFEWVDISHFVRGMSWRQGADEFFGRPRPGVLTLTLASPDGALSAWNVDALEGRGAFLTAGLLIRVGLRSATDERADGWLPQICGHVESWPSEIAGPNAADEWATVTVIETVSALARIDDKALIGDELASWGGVNPVYMRVGALLERCGWKWGGYARWDYDDPFPYLQQTNMAQNRLAECYLSADSGLCVFRTGRTGVAELLPDPFSGGVYYTPDPAVLWQFTELGGDAFLSTNQAADDWDAAIIPEAVVWANDDEALVNASTAAVANTSVSVTNTDLASIRRFNGRRSTSRSDLITEAADATTVATAITDRISFTSRLVRRCDSVTLHNLVDPDGVGIQASIDWGNGVLIADYRYRAGYRMIAGGRVNAMEHTITPLAGRVNWTTRLELITLDTDLQEI